MARFPEPRARVQEDKAVGEALAELLDAKVASPSSSSSSSLPAPVLSAVEAARSELRGAGTK